MAAASLGARLYGFLFAVAAIVSAVMLVTDSNLRTDFGTVTSGYYLHWYVILITAVADAVGAVGLWVVGSRRAVQAGVVASGLLILILVGDIFTYSSVGFASAGDFANYLFGITYYGGNIRYLYDLLLGVYVVTFGSGLGLLAVRRSPPATVASSAAAPSNPHK
ncbi:MAG: hypothetical protein AAFA34_01215 [Thermoplasmata archaeon]|jgi:hypothetical protein